MIVKVLQSPCEDGSIVLVPENESDRRFTRAAISLRTLGGEIAVRRSCGGFASASVAAIDFIDVCPNCKGDAVNHYGGQTWRCTTCGGDGVLNKAKSKAPDTLECPACQSTLGLCGCRYKRDAFLEGGE